MAAAMDEGKEKVGSFTGNDTTDDVAVESVYTRTNRSSSVSVPGAFRVGNDDDDTKSNISGESCESGIILVPRASLVDEMSRDIETASTPAILSATPPLVHAEKKVEAGTLENVEPHKLRRNTRLFRLCMLLFCLLVAGLLGGILASVLSDGSSSVGTIDLDVQPSEKPTRPPKKPREIVAANIEDKGEGD